MPPNWSCQPPPVRISASRRNVNSPISSTSVRPSKAAMTAEPSMELVPIPEPFGKSAAIVTFNPREPNSNPVTARALFTKAHQSRGSAWSASSSAVLISRLLPKSRDTIFTNLSLRGETITSIGLRPSSVTAAFKTAPPSSLQIGGVSLHPPAKSILTGATTLISRLPRNFKSRW